MEIYCGTSGFSYSWNPDGLEWYLQNSGLDCLELNSSFYRFPFPAYINSWKKKNQAFNANLRWSIKVNRLITHVYKFGSRAEETWKKFKNLFDTLDNNIDFYLFQIPPSLTDKSIEKIKKFAGKTRLKERFALEFRNEKLFESKVDWAKKLGITLVSIDAPIGLKMFNTNGIVYMRVHGRTGWYFHNYSQKELKEIAEKILGVKPEKIYVFFNNNHNMLANARQMMKILNQTY